MRCSGAALGIRGIQRTGICICSSGATGLRIIEVDIDTFEAPSIYGAVNRGIQVPLTGA